MAKKNERAQAKILFVELGKTSKEIGLLLEVSERTLVKWRRDGLWDDLRAARVANSAVRVDNIRLIINDLSQRRIDLGNKLRSAEVNEDIEEVSSIRVEIASIDDGVSKWNKTLENVAKEGAISVSTHIAVLEMVFNYMRVFNEKLYLKSIDFQDAYIDHLLSNNGH